MPCPTTRSGDDLAGTTVGVGQDEEPATPVTSARFSRREQARLRLVAHRAKISGDVGVSQGQVTLDVLAEDPFRADLVDDPGDLGPQVAGIVTSSPVTVEAEGLAGIAGCDEMNAIAPRSTVERSKIVPDSSLTQGLVCHPRHDSGRRTAFPLDKSHSSVSGFGDVKAEIEPGVAGAERDASEIVLLRQESGM